MVAKELMEQFVNQYGPLATYSGPSRYTNGPSLDVLLTLAHWRRPQRVLEMYTAYGHSALALASVCPEAQIFTFDVCKEMGGHDVRSPFVNEVASIEEVGSAIREAPEELSSRIVTSVRHAADLPAEIALHAPYQVTYVDGDHTWRRVVEDTKTALRFTENTGVIVWDDYWEVCREVLRFIEVLSDRVEGAFSTVDGCHNCFVVLDEKKRRELLNAVSDL